MIDPKSRNIEPVHLMESLFRNTDLEIRIPMNLNVLNADTVPGVLDLKQAPVSLPRAPPRSAAPPVPPSSGRD